MGKVLGIGALVLGIWCFVEVYTNGAANAFDGALVRIGLVDEAEEGAAVQTTGTRVRNAASRAHAEADARRERLLTE